MKKGRLQGLAKQEEGQFVRHAVPRLGLRQISRDMCWRNRGRSVGISEPRKAETLFGARRPLQTGCLDVRKPTAIGRVIRGSIQCPRPQSARKMGAIFHAFNPKSHEKPESYPEMCGAIGAGLIRCGNLWHTCTRQRVTWLFDKRGQYAHRIFNLP